MHVEMLGVFLSCSPSYSLRQVSCLNWNSLIQLKELGSEAQGSFCFCRQGSGMTGFYVGEGDQIQVLMLAEQA